MASSRPSACSRFAGVAVAALLDGVVLVESPQARFVQRAVVHQRRRCGAVESFLPGLRRRAAREIVGHLVVVDGREDGGGLLEVVPDVQPGAFRVHLEALQPVLAERRRLLRRHEGRRVVGVDRVVELHEQVQPPLVGVGYRRVGRRLAAPVAGDAQPKPARCADRAGADELRLRAVLGGVRCAPIVARPGVDHVIAERELGRHQRVVHRHGAGHDVAEVAFR